MNRNSWIIVNALSFLGNFLVGHLLPAMLALVESIVCRRLIMAICDRGYREEREIWTTRIEIPEAGKSPKPEHEKLQSRARFRRRSAIELIVGHLQNDHRMFRKYLKGRMYDYMALFMACAAFNFWKFILILNFFQPDVRPVRSCA